MHTHCPASCSSNSLPSSSSVPPSPVTSVPANIPDCPHYEHTAGAVQIHTEEVREQWWRAQADGWLLLRGICRSFVFELFREVIRSMPGHHPGRHRSL